MPRRKKRIIKKKINKSSSFPKRNSGNRVKREDVQSTSRSTIEKRASPQRRLVVTKEPSVKYFDNGGVKRIYCPFNRFAKNRTADKEPPKMYKNNSRPTGLSPKEKSYLICSCQARFSRYVRLKNLAADAIKENKIFTIYGSCLAVRNALTERGWVEKITANKMNLTKIRNGNFSNKNEVLTELERLLLSNLVEKHNPNFIWTMKDEQHDTTIDMNKDYTTIVNKLKVDAEWTTKQGLCSSLKRNYWFYIENVAEVIGPRTYISFDTSEIEGFVKDYKITACTSLLKWILSMVANDRPVFVESGKISMNVVVFALNRCKEYLARKQNKDIDRAISGASAGQWNAYLKKYYRIIAKEDVFQADKDNRLPLYLAYAKFLLKEMHKYRPQLSCEGCHNIWIIKPAHCSRGRGIRMASKLGVITNLLNKANTKHVIQKYIEEPLLIHETKFDIRQYYLVTSTYPLVIWMYQDCYLKFSSQKYNLKNYHESIHLTNNAVQRKYKNCSGRHAELPQNNMWDLNKYKDYLNKIEKNKVWDKVIYPGMKKSIIGIMLSCQDSLSVCKNQFELYGCDFILDKEYKPWLIEINSNPDLGATTPITAKICPAVIADIIKVVIDYANNPTSPTGKFECIYRQPMTVPRYGGTDMVVRGYALPNYYFYKGNFEIQESYSCADIDEEHDIKTILNKLKQVYYTEDIMVEPEDDCDVDQKKEQEAGTHSTKSEYELNEAATVINGQLDELLSRITSEPNCGSKCISRYDMPKSYTSLTLHQTSESYINSWSRKFFLSKFNSVDTFDIQKFFNFSNPDDGPRGKGSLFEFDTKKALKAIASESSKSKELENVSLMSSKHEAIATACRSFENMFLATSKLISFINEKEKEYFANNC